MTRKEFDKEWKIKMTDKFITWTFNEGDADPWGAFIFAKFHTLSDAALNFIVQEGADDLTRSGWEQVDVDKCRELLDERFEKGLLG